MKTQLAWTVPLSVIAVAGGCVASEAYNTDELVDQTPAESLSLGLANTDSGPTNITISADEHAKMREYIRRRNDPRIVRDVVDDGEGEIVNCVDRRLQHGFDNPITSFAEPPKIVMPNNSPTPSQPPRFAHGTVGRACPPDTVPQPRIELEALERFDSLASFIHRSMAPTLGDSDPHQHEQITFPAGQPPPYSLPAHFQGAYSWINYWKPYVGTNSFSLSQIWVSAGSPANKADTNLQTVEVGWHVYPAHYASLGYTNPGLNREFIFYTKDNYHTGCYNLECSAFVQTTSWFVPGGYFLDSSMSVPGGAQFEVDHLWVNGGGNWHLRWNGQWVGYYPASAFSGTVFATDVGADRIAFGGEVYNVAGDFTPYVGPHTDTDMGSGVPPDGGAVAAMDGYVAYQRWLAYIDSSAATLLLPPGGYTSVGVGNEACYRSQVVVSDPNPKWGNVSFFFGGIGFSASCQ